MGSLYRLRRLKIGGNNMASKEEIQQVMKILWDLDAEDVDQALDSSHIRLTISMARL